MPSFAKASIAGLLFLTPVAPMGIAPAHAACSGTLCDVLHIEETPSAGQWAQEQAEKAPKEPLPASGCSGTICDTLHITMTTPSAGEWAAEQAAKAPKPLGADECEGTICDMFFKSKSVSARKAPAPETVAAAPEPMPETRIAKKAPKKKRVVATDDASSVTYDRDARR